MRLPLDILMTITLLVGVASLAQCVYMVEKKQQPCPVGTPGMMKEIKHTKGIWV